VKPFSKNSFAPIYYYLYSGKKMVLQSSYLNFILNNKNCQAIAIKNHPICSTGKKSGREIADSTERDACNSKESMVK